MHTDNKAKDILALRDCSTQGLDDTAIIAKAKHSFNFQGQEKSTL